MALACAQYSFGGSLEAVQHINRHESLDGAGEAAAMDADSALAMQGLTGHSQITGPKVLKRIPNAADDTAGHKLFIDLNSQVVIISSAN